MGRPADFRLKLREMNEQYLLAVPSNTTIRDREVPPPEWCGNGRPPQRQSTRVDRWLKERDDSEWTALDVRDGEKGPLLVEALKRNVETGKRSRPTAADELLVVIRYKDRDSRVVKTDYYLSNAAAATPLAELARAAKAEHRIEECSTSGRRLTPRRSKSEAGLADYEVRNWTGWQHHQTLCLLASWFLLVETRRAEKKDPGDYVPADTSRGRCDSETRARMRFEPKRDLADRTAVTA